MSEVLLDIATRFGVPTAIAAFALFWYYKLSEKMIDQSIKREEVHRQDSKDRETQMRETIRQFSESTNKMDKTLTNVNGSMEKISSNVDRNNKILEQVCTASGIKVVTLGGGNGES